MEIMKNKKIKQLIKKLYENGELDKIINMDEDVCRQIGDPEFCEQEKKAAQEYKDLLDVLSGQEDIEKMSLIPLMISCKSVLFLQTLLFQL